MGARELLHELTGAGFSLAVDGDKLVIRPASKLTDELRMALRAAKPDLMALLVQPTTAASSTATSRPYRLSQAQADAAHAKPWGEAVIARFVARVALFLRRGISATNADDLAERLHLCDLQDEGRHLCLECVHLAGRTPTEWRCGNARVADVGRDLPAALVVLPQRCPGFLPCVELQRRKA